MERKTIFTDSFTSIKSILKKRLKDPAHRNPKRNSWIHAGFPNLKKHTYPFIIIQSADISDSDYCFGRTERNFTFRFLITVHSKDATQCDEIANDILYVFDTYRDDFKDKGLHNLQIDSSPFAQNLDENGDIIYTRAIGVIFQNRL